MVLYCVAWEHSPPGCPEKCNAQTHYAFGVLYLDIRSRAAEGMRCATKHTEERVIHTGVSPVMAVKPYLLGVNERSRGVSTE